MPKRFWSDLTTEEFKALDAGATTAVLPVGAIEQHGPHLPVSVDCDIPAAIIERALPLLGELSVLFLPMAPIGKSNEHIGFPGTLTFSAETLIRAWTEIGDSVARAGIRKLVLFNGHGGNLSSMDIVARELRVRHNMLTASCSWFMLGAQEGLFEPYELTHGIHAGDLETSVMLAARGDLVRMEKAEKFVSRGEEWAKRFEFFGVGGRPVKPGWLIEDLNAAGACGNAANATREKGEQVLNRAAERFAAFLREFASLSTDGPDVIGT